MFVAVAGWPTGQGGAHSADRDVRLVLLAFQSGSQGAAATAGSLLHNQC